MMIDTRTRRLAVPSLVLLLWVAGCSGPRATVDNRPDLPDAFPSHTVAQIHEQLRAGLPDTIATFTGKANLSLRTPELSGNVTARLAHRHRDSLYMSLTATLGIEAARILVTPDSFFVYDRINKKLNYGSMDYASQVMPAAFTSNDVFPNLLGMLLPESTINWQLEADTAYYHLRDPDDLRHFIIDPTIWRVVRYEERSRAGTLVEARTFTEHDRFADVFVPRRIILQRPLDDTNVSMYYRELTFNPSTLSMTLEVGDSVERVLIDENFGTTND